MIDRIALPTAVARPGNREHHARIAALVEQLLAGREAHRAKLVANDKPVTPAIDDGLRLIRALSALWRWAIDPAAGPEPEPDPKTGWDGAWPYELAAETRTIAERARARADAAGDAATIETADLCEVLAWYMHREGCESRIVRIVDLDRRIAWRAAQLAKAA